MRELKVGDKVKVRSDLFTGFEYGSYVFYEDMKKYQGKTFSIDRRCTCGCSCFVLDKVEDCRFSPEMLELVEEPTQDAVNTPSHYLHGGIETIEVIRMMLTPEEFRGYCKGNIIKYRERAMFKGNAEEDFAKALKYKEFMEVARR